MKKIIFVFAFVFASSGLFVSAQDESIPEEDNGNDSETGTCIDEKEKNDAHCFTLYGPQGQESHVCKKPSPTQPATLNCKKGSK